jgi:hypothetical protein
MQGDVQIHQKIKTAILSNLPKKEMNIKLFILSFALGLLLKLRYIGRDFWHDESFQILFSQMPLNFIFSSNDVHPPLFTIFTKAMVWFTTEPLFLRLTMVIMSLMFALIFFQVIRQYFGEHIATYSLVLLNMSPTFAYYSTEFRSYIFVMLLTILQIQAFNKMLSASKPVNPFVYILLSTAMLYSHYMAGLIILVQVVYLIFKGKLFKYWAEFLLIGIYSGYLIFYIIKTFPKIQSFWFKDIDLISFVSTFFYLINFPENFIFQIITIIIFLFIGWGIFKERRQHPQILMYIFLPVVVMWIVSQFFPFYHHRYFLFGGIFIFVLGAIGIKHWKPETSFWKPSVIIGMMLFPIFFNFEFDTPLQDSAESFPDDGSIVVHTSTFSMTPYKVLQPNNHHLLVTKLTREQLFTAGGSVVLDEEIIPRSESGFNMPKGRYYFVSEQERLGGVDIYDKDGIKVTKYG